MNRLAIRSALVALTLAAGLASAQTPVDTSFTYQGRLTDNGAAPTANYDIKFELYDDPTAGNLLGTISAVNIVASVRFASLNTTVPRRRLTSSRRCWIIR